MSQIVVMQDGRLRPDGRVSIESDDPGLLHGRTCFETLRVRGGRIVELDAHLERLTQSATWMGIPLVSSQQLAFELMAVLAALGEAEAVLRVMATVGGSRILRGEPAPPRRRQAVVISLPWEPPAWLPGWIKHGSRAASHHARGEADEAIFVDSAGLVGEGTWSNVVAVIDGKLRTAPADGRILAGVTRGEVLRAARLSGVVAEELRFGLGDAIAELYLCSTTHGLVPVVFCNGKRLAGWGPIGLALDKAMFQTWGVPWFEPKFDDDAWETPLA
jgi:branched-subunit amino acid aminotransferase/4-amino-4-deoxychorismate lyase